MTEYTYQEMDGVQPAFLLLVPFKNQRRKICPLLSFAWMQMEIGFGELISRVMD